MNADRLLALYENVAEAPDAIARLRRFVLDLAVRGKLVEQDPADEPASELLKRLAAEKARLAKAGAIRKTAALNPKMVDPPHEVPASWRWVSLGTVFLYDAGEKCEPRSLDPSLWLLELEDIEKETGRLLARVNVADRESRSTKSRFRPADILYGKLRPYLTKVIVADEPGYSTTEIVAIRPLARLCSEYCAVALRCPDFIDYVTRLGQGTKMPRLRTEDAIVSPFPLPPLAEQGRIVAKVDELLGLLGRLEAARQTREATRDRLTAATLARLTAPDTDAEAPATPTPTADDTDPAATLATASPRTFPKAARFALDALPALTTRPDQIKPLRQTILNLAVRGKLVAQDPADEPAVDYVRGLDEMPPKSRKLVKALNPSECGGDLPASWVWLPLGAIIRAMDAGWSPQCENHPRSREDEWGVLKTTAVQALSFDSMQHKLLPAKLTPRPEFQAEVGDILLTRAGPKNRVGVSCVVDVPCPKLMISDKLIRFHAVGDLSPRYIALTLNAGHSFDQIEAAKSGMAVMQMNISQAKLRAIPVPLPPLAEQHRIVAKVDALMALCDRLEAALTTTDTTRARLLESLLHEALSPAEPIPATRDDRRAAE